MGAAAVQYIGTGAVVVVAVAAAAVITSSLLVEVESITIMNPVPPKSYFQSLVLLERSRTNNRNFTPGRRDSEDWITFKQYPVGWMFYSDLNLAYITRVLSEFFGGLSIDVLSPFMLREYNGIGVNYDTRASNELDPLHSKFVIDAVALMNKNVVEAVKAHMHATVTRTQIFDEYMSGFVPRYTQPAATRVTKRAGVDTDKRARPEARTIYSRESDYINSTINEISSQMDATGQPPM